MKSRLTDETDRGQMPLFLPQNLVPHAQRFNLAIIVLTFIQIGFVYTNPINSRANIALSGSLGSSSSQQQPYNITTTTRNLRSRNRSPNQADGDILGTDQTHSLNEQVVQPMGSSFDQGNHFPIPPRNERINTLPQSTSQNRESIERGPGRGYLVNRPSPNVTAAEAPPMYSPADFISEGSGNGPLNNYKPRPGKLDDTEDGDDDEDEDDYDDRETIANGPESENENFPRQLNKKPASAVGSTDWPDASNNPYVPFRGPGNTNSINRPVYQQINMTTPTTQQPSLRPQQNYSSFEQIDNNANDSRLLNQAKPSKPLLIPSSAPSDKIDTILSANKNIPIYDNPTDIISEYSSKPNRTENRPPSLSHQIDKFNLNMTASSRPKSPHNNLISTDPKIPLESNVTLSTDSKSKDQDVDYDYEEEMEEDDAEDNSTFEDGEPMDVERHDNKTATSYSQFDNENQPPNNAKNTPNKINELPITAISITTESPARIPAITVEQSSVRESSTSPNPFQYDPDTSEGQDYGDEEDDEDQEGEEDVLEDDDLDNEDDLGSETDSVKNSAVNSPPIQMVPTPIINANPVPDIANSSRKGPDNDPLGNTRAQTTPPNNRYNSVGSSTESPKEPEVLRKVPSSPIPPFAIRTTTNSYLPSTTQPPTTTTTTTVTSLLTLKPTSNPSTTRTPSLTNWYTTPKSIDAIPSSGANPGIVNFGPGSLEDDTGLTKQIYDKAVEVYQTVHKAVVSAVEAVSQPNIDWSSSTFEPLLSQPLFFMLALGGAIIGLVLTMMLIVYIVSYQIQPKDDISLY